MKTEIIIQTLQIFFSFKKLFKIQETLNLTFLEESRVTLSKTHEDLDPDNINVRLTLAASGEDWALCNRKDYSCNKGEHSLTRVSSISRNRNRN